MYRFFLFLLVCSFVNPIGLLTGDGAPVFMVAGPLSGVHAERQTSFSLFFFPIECRPMLSHTTAGLSPKVCEPQFCAHYCKKKALFTLFLKGFVHFLLISCHASQFRRCAPVTGPKHNCSVVSLAGQCCHAYASCSSNPLLSFLLSM
uniref:Putative secreted protein n=1 Tax=Amblyomma cajennense TaxID=34607 RepID=A0A023FC03_AMBCJ